MGHKYEAVAGFVGVMVGLAAGAGSVSWLSADQAAGEEAVVEQQEHPAYEGPREPDRLVQWVRKHPRGE
ncbi:hypothetical protein [Nocardioides sp. GXQ0305]|uniref:hypothetical protein n=1 Tax=Nocardioides sp. GXQ0305 TaxID=3423912 RepID=UPI003D7DEB40